MGSSYRTAVALSSPRRRQHSSARLQHFGALLIIVLACFPLVSAFSSSPSVRSPLFSTPSRPVFTDVRSIGIKNKGVSCPRRSLALFTKRKSSSNEFDLFPNVEVSTTDKLLLVVMTALMLFGLGELMSISGQGSWRYFLAGGICASTSHAITTPIDVVKVCLYRIMIMVRLHVSDAVSRTLFRLENKWTRRFETPPLCKPPLRLLEKKVYTRLQQDWAPPLLDTCLKEHSSLASMKC